jgi:hypothetical protein
MPVRPHFQATFWGCDRLADALFSDIRSDSEDGVEVPRMEEIWINMPKIFGFWSVCPLNSGVPGPHMDDTGYRARDRYFQAGVPLR